MATITLYSNYPFTAGSPHNIDFTDIGARNSFFSSLRYATFTNVDYEPRRGARLTLPLSIMDAMKYNYMKWSDGSNEIYFYIEDYEFLNDHPTTQLYISKDVWMTHQFDVVLYPSKVHRRHMPRWNGSTPIIYPVDEGNPRTMVLRSKTPLDMNSNPIFQGSKVWPALYITDKKLQESAEGGHDDGLYYYGSFISLNGEFVGHPDTGVVWTNVLQSTFIDQFEQWGVGLNPLVGAYVVPWFPSRYVSRVYPSHPYYQFNWGDKIETKTGIYALQHFVKPLANPSETISLSGYDTPTRNTSTGRTASYLYEPQCYADNATRYIITDAMGFPAMFIPSTVMMGSPNLIRSLEILTLTPQLRFQINSTSSTASDGLECTLPCPPLDIPQSTYYDYVYQAKEADRRIMENNIRTAYYQGAVNLVTGTLAGAASGGMYAQAYGNSKTVAGQAAGAGALSAAIQGTGSLINSWLDANNQRDNFALNEQKIKNTPSPPIGGTNPFGLDDNGISLITLQADPESMASIFGQYHAYGVIIDRVMNINLRTRRYYDFIQTDGLLVGGSLTQEDRAFVQRIFDNGVTMWHSDSWQGVNYSYDNVER